MNFRPFRFGLPVLLLAGIVLITGCSSDNPNGSFTPIPTPQIIGESALGEPISLGPGQSIELSGEGVDVVFDRVIIDSRCPVSDECAEIGTAHIAMKVHMAGEESVLTEFLIPPGGSTEALAGIYTVTIISLSPDSSQKSEFDPSDYQLTFKVSKK